MHIVSPLMPFAPISWWAHTIDSPSITFDVAEHYEKMSYRNKYRISGANNPIQLSLPLVNGRAQRSAMKDVLLHNEEKWQVQHWRTLVSVYRQTPYWEYYEQSLQVLFETPFTHLIDFNRAAYKWLLPQLKVKQEVNETDIYTASYPEDVKDLRKWKPAKDEGVLAQFPKYYQVFEDRIGFQPNLSILDLLFSEGPHAAGWVREHRDVLLGI